MIDVFFFSIANKKSNEEINDILLELKDSSYIPESDKVLIKHTLTVGAHGKYPDKTYYEDYYQYTKGMSSLSEIKTYVDKLKDYYQTEELVSHLLKSINESVTKQQLVDSVVKVIDYSDKSETEDYEDYVVQGYSDTNQRPVDSGFMSGIAELDQITNGFQPATIGSVCAYVSEGKSTFWISSIFKNIKAGKKGVLFSIELPPSMVWMQLLSRFLYEEKSIEIAASELIQQTLTDEMVKVVKEHEPEFKEMMRESLLILDESALDIRIMSEPRLLTRLYKKLERKLGGLDFVVYDHVNQFDLMFPDQGNKCIKTIQSSGKTYKNQNGIGLFTGFAVQCNREGWKRARKQNGKYTLNAIADLNEVEKSSTYVVFLYTTEDMRMTQETKISMMKNRLGGLLVEPVTTAFNPVVMVVGELIDPISYDDSFGELTGTDFSSFDDDF